MEEPLSFEQRKFLCSLHDQPGIYSPGFNEMQSLNQLIYLGLVEEVLSVMGRTLGQSRTGHFQATKAGLMIGDLLGRSKDIGLEDLSSLKACATALDDSDRVRVNQVINLYIKHKGNQACGMLREAWRW